MRKFVVPLLWLSLLAGFVFAAEPVVSDRVVELLRNLPHGVTDNPSLIVRSRHVATVLFSGAGSSSRYGFSQNDGVISDGLWLRLVNRGSEDYAKALIVFGPRFDVSSYNSLVFWFRARKPGQRVSLTFQDRSWTETKKSQGRTAIFPKEGFPVQAVQVVVPFSVLSSKGSIDYSRLNQVGLEFGRDLKNSDGELAEILGVAFIAQSTPLNQILVIPTEAIKPEPVPTPEIHRVRLPVVEAKKNIVPSKPVVALAKPKPTPLVKPAQNAKVKPTPPELPKISTAVAYVAPAIQVSPSPSPKESPSSLSETPFKEIPELRKASPGAESSPPVRRAVVRALARLPGEFLYVALSLLILLWALLVAIRRRNTSARIGIGPILHRLNWPLLADGLANTLKAERRFWKKLSDKKITEAWLSPYNVNVDRSPSDEHHGESFLLRQIRTAKSFHIRVFPSLCFVRTLFHFESFLENPEIYLTRRVSANESHLSDEELRIRHIGFFPVWIPPFWQKKQNLPQKLLVAYGKLPGSMATSDSAQFNLRSPQLREMAIRVLERFAAVGTGVRIEGASALLNSSLNLHWGAHFSEMGLAKDNEFWTEVIGAVKKKYPNFLFIADGAAGTGPKLLEMGFNSFENNNLMQVLINQIRLEEVGSFENFLTPDSAPLLFQSIYDVSPFFRSHIPGTLPRQQTLLGSMLIGFLPGVVEHDGQIPQELNRFFTLAGHWGPFRRGKFVLLRSTSESVLAFARWEKKVVYIVIANFSSQRRTISVGFEPFFDRLEARKLFLFNDALHGASLLAELKSDLRESPAVAVLGQDLKEIGLTVSMGELSLRLFSVNLGQPVSHEIDSQVRELRKT